MRHINLDELELPDGWAEKAKAAFEKIHKLKGKERDEAIEKASGLWKELKPALEKLSHEKCWYCESLQDRSDNPVDHYRPKGEIAECPSHPGYWWLAFKWENYRFACTYCNSRHIDKQNDTSGGKSTHFPIANEADRVLYDEKSPNEDLLLCTAEEYEQESPLLLDPTNSTDPGLLWFDESGQVTAKFQGPNDAWLKLRAETSKEAFHLHHKKITRARNALYNRMKRQVVAGEKEWRRYKRDHDYGAKRTLDAIIDELRRLVKGDAEYSAAGRAFLEYFRIKHEWVKLV